MNKNIFDFKGRTAIVTGGGQGFGLDVAKRLLEGGAKVIIWDIDQKLLDEAVETPRCPTGKYFESAKNTPTPT